MSLLLVLGIHTGRASAGDLSVVVHGLRNDEGVVHVALHDRPAGFPAAGAEAFRAVTVPIRGGVASVRFDDLPAGRYAVSFVHDEDADGAMDQNPLGVPTEGYGASNDPPRRLGPPRFDDAAFTLGIGDLALDLHPIYWM